MARSIRSLLLVALVPAALSGCASSGMSARVIPGPPAADPGPDAYRIWHDRGGWHLRVSSDVVRRFHGEIRGRWGRVKLVDVPEDAVQTGWNWIRFSFLADEDAGLDWRGSGCVRLALYVDGDERPLRVFVGAEGASPARLPATVCP